MRDSHILCRSELKSVNHVQNCSGALPTSYPMGTGDSSPEGKAVGARKYTSTLQ